MYTVINDQSELALVTMEEVKRQCRLMPSFTMDDGYLNSLILTCSELAQKYTKRLLTSGDISGESDHYRAVVQLPWGGVTTITELRLDGVASTDYTFSHITQKIKIGPAYANLQVDYKSKYNKSPTLIKQAVLIMISTFYSNRDDYVTGVTLERIPMTSLNLLNAVRIYES